ncbi:MAG: bifunctional pantoate--beta-alanine ligase/(d)CMP kinase, partial [Microcoleus sp. SIO2G3]|nr:bifunctional pantoate--beta-alanine ligase/(d)CMP kinase [Microcoleus sp. SIO2G3]
MRLFTTIAGLRCYLQIEKFGQRQHWAVAASATASPSRITVGLVPTMGALHQGHLSLIDRARQENDRVIVSIFVNPLQFGANEDFQQYPRTLDQDKQLCEQAGVDAIFAPDATELYGSVNFSEQDLTQVIPPEMMIRGLCGRSRPGHFQGVATVVTKLLNIVQPDRAYFGQKDAQQLAVLRRVVADLNLPVEIVPCPIVREASGLALSSRNQYLSAQGRSQAAVIYRGLQQAKQRFDQGERQSSVLIAAALQELAIVPSLQPEYVELVHPTTMKPLERIEETGLLAVAARLESTRLIDNLMLRDRRPIVAIDGPAGAGKSTVVRQVAQRLGLLHLDTGAMYRSVTWLVLQSGIAIDDEPSIAELASRCDIQLDGQQVFINGQDVTHDIRSLEVTAQVSAIAAQPAVRQELVKRQQQYGRRGGVVMEGRDIGTFVFPDAELKIFLTASVQERARRRQQDLKDQGRPDVSLEDLEWS